MISIAEENYLKAIYKLMEKEQKSASTNAIAKEMRTTPASVTDMIKRLAQKELVNYAPYKGVTLTNTGIRKSTELIRKHRLWEYFLTEKLYFRWDEVHDIAEELEHINSVELINRLDNFLGYPKFDPHGDPIPNEEGKFTLRNQVPLNILEVGEICELVGIAEHGNAFLAYLDQISLKIGSRISVISRIEYDLSLKVMIENREQVLSSPIAKKLYVKKLG